MTRRLILTIGALLSAPAAQADIFKCMVNGKAVYQAAPCATEKDETALHIKRVSPAPMSVEGYPLPAPASARDGEKAYLEKKLLKARIAAEQAEAARRQASAEADIVRAEARAREADAWNDRMAADADESDARARYYDRKARGYGRH